MTARWYPMRPRGSGRSASRIDQSKKKKKKKKGPGVFISDKSPTSKPPFPSKIEIRTGAQRQGSRTRGMMRILERPSLVRALILLIVGLLARGAAALSSERWTDRRRTASSSTTTSRTSTPASCRACRSASASRSTSAAATSCASAWSSRSRASTTTCTDQVARHDLYKEVIDARIIRLTANTAWETYDKRFTDEGLADLAARRETLSPEPSGAS